MRQRKCVCARTCVNKSTTRESTKIEGERGVQKVAVRGGRRGAYRHRGHYVLRAATREHSERPEQIRLKIVWSAVVRVHDPLSKRPVAVNETQPVRPPACKSHGARHYRRLVNAQRAELGPGCRCLRSGVPCRGIASVALAPLLKAAVVLCGQSKTCQTDLGQARRAQQEVREQ